MMKSSFLVLIFAIFLAILAQPPPPPNIPPHCGRPPPGVQNPNDCCKIPSMFEEKDLEECGIPKPEEHSPRDRFRGPPDCSKQTCILTKYNLLKDDKINYDAVTEFLDKWAAKNPDFKPAVEKAKERCLGDLPGPPHLCEADKMVFCIGSTLFVECPTWEDSDNCTKLKNHIESCKAAASKQP